jgi:hypothetical protein
MAAWAGVCTKTDSQMLIGKAPVSGAEHWPKGQFAFFKVKLRAKCLIFMALQNYPQFLWITLLISLIWLACA